MERRLAGRMRQEVYEEKERQRREAGLRHQGGPHARPHRYGKDNHFRFTKTEDSAEQDAGEDGEPPKKKMSLNWLCKFFMEGGAAACRNGINVRPRAATALRARARRCRRESLPCGVRARSILRLYQRATLSWGAPSNRDAAVDALGVHRGLVRWVCWVY